MIPTNDNEPLASDADDEFEGLNEFGMTPEEFEFFLKHEII